MRLPAGLWLFAASAVVAAPQKEDLPPGAVGRLAGPASPGKGEVTALLYLNEHTLFVGTSAGWTTWDLQKRKPQQARPVGGPTAAAARDAERLFVGSARKLHAVEPLESATAEPAQSWDSAADLVSVVAVDRRGRRVVFADGERKLTVLDPATGKATGAVELPARPVAAALAANGRVLAVVTVGGAARSTPWPRPGRLNRCGSSGSRGQTGRPSSSPPTAGSSPFPRPAGSPYSKASRAGRSPRSTANSARPTSGLSRSRRTVGGSRL